MKKLVAGLTALVFSSSTLVVEAATPRAAEGPTATVVSTSTPAPRVKKAPPAKGKKQAAKKPAKAKKKRASRAH